MLLYHFHFNFILFVHTGHADFGFIGVQYYTMLFLAFKKVSPPNEKIPALNKVFHPCHPTGMGRFLPYPFNVIWKTLSCFTSPKRGVEIISKYFIVWLWTATQLNTSKNGMSLKVLLIIWDGFLISPWKYRIWILKNESILKITSWKRCWLLFYPKFSVGVSFCFT